MINNTIKNCNNFIDRVLKKEEWFKLLVNNKFCDLLLLTGTSAEKTADTLSDIDIFLVCTNDAQKKYSLKPVKIYNYQGNVFEISIVV